MAAAYAVSCKLQAFSCCFLNNNKNHKSFEIPTKFQIPKSLSFGNSKSKSHLRNVPCSSSLSSRFSVNPDNPVFKLLDEVINQRILSLTVLVLDEDGQLGQKIDELDAKRTYESDVEKRTNIVLDEVVPLLLDSADRWISSRLTMSSDVRVSFEKLRSEEMMSAPNIEANRSNSIRCTKVFLDVSFVIFCTISDKLKNIHTREDLKVLLHHMMSMDGVKSAFVVSIVALLPKEKATALQDFTHSTT
ncbi:uncharacterized protein LOC141594447 [Silene latifolia]|uniref:uncharacterized protein LOC141594447 n=1 Tax=Silene latifolia TaxID=37657 RepID=UPI003D786321